MDCDRLSNLFLVNLGIKAKKKRLGGGGGGGGGGGLPPITPYTILGKAHYSAQTNSGLTQPNCSFELMDLNSGQGIQDLNGVVINNYEVRDYITGTLRGIAFDSPYPFNQTPALNITISQNHRNIDMGLGADVGIYNPNGANIGVVDYTMSVVVDTHNLVAQGFIQNGSPTVQGNANPNYHSNFGGNLIELLFNSSIVGGLQHPINSGELVFQITATVLSKAGNTALTTGNAANAAETTKQSFYLDFIVQ